VERRGAPGGHRPCLGTAEASQRAHGGTGPGIRHVLLISVDGLHQQDLAWYAPVETTQIAPTILSLLGLDPGELQAVRIEHTRVLPGLGGNSIP
jgi:hypothetical protein